MEPATRAPPVSIGLPVYNGEQFIRETLESLLAQDFRDFELIISDNASADRTEEICREFVSRDPRVSYHRNAENIGAVGNFNQVFDRARGKYFMWASAHDRWAPDFLSKCVAVLESDPSVVLCYTHSSCLDADGNVFMSFTPQTDTRGLDRLSRYRIALWRVPCFAVYGLHRVRALRQVMPLGNTQGADLILLLELSLLGAFACLPERLFRFRFLMSRSGDWPGYFRRLNLQLTWWNVPLLFWRYAKAHWAKVCRHAGTSSEWVYLAMTSAVRIVVLFGGFMAGLVLATVFPGIYRRLANRWYRKNREAE